MSQQIEFSRSQHLGRILLNRPQALNALSFPMIKAFYKQLLAWKKDPSIHAVLVEAKHDHIFCAGGDVRFIYENHETPQIAKDFFWHEYRLNALIITFEKPYIALMNGLVMGGGAGISLHGHYPVATEKFVFAMPETAIGLFPDVGMSHLLSRLPFALGLYLGLTGQRLGATDALSVGLIHCVVPENSLADLIENLIASDLSQHAVRTIQDCLAAVSLERDVLPCLDEQTQKRIETCFSCPTMEAIVKALQQDGSEWARETQTRLLQSSPLSLKITLKQLQRAKTLDVMGCLKQDEVLVQHFIQGNDFYEGVRARLIDKDQTPRWSPASLHEVTDEQVEAYFT